MGKTYILTSITKKRRKEGQPIEEIIEVNGVIEGETFGLTHDFV